MREVPVNVETHYATTSTREGRAIVYDATVLMYAQEVTEEMENCLLETTWCGRCFSIVDGHLRSPPAFTKKSETRRWVTHALHGEGEAAEWYVLPERNGRTEYDETADEAIEIALRDRLSDLRLVEQGRAASDVPPMTEHFADADAASAGADAADDGVADANGTTDVVKCRQYRAEGYACRGVVSVGARFDGPDGPRTLCKACVSRYTRDQKKKKAVAHKKVKAQKAPKGAAAAAAAAAAAGAPTCPGWGGSCGTVLGGYTKVRRGVDDKVLRCTKCGLRKYRARVKAAKAAEAAREAAVVAADTADVGEDSAGVSDDTAYRTEPRTEAREHVIPTLPGVTHLTAVAVAALADLTEMVGRFEWGGYEGDDRDRYALDFQLDAWNKRIPAGDAVWKTWRVVAKTSNLWFDDTIDESRRGEPLPWCNMVWMRGHAPADGAESMLHAIWHALHGDIDFPRATGVEYEYKMSREQKKEYDAAATHALCMMGPVELAMREWEGARAQVALWALGEGGPCADFVRDFLERNGLSRTGDEKQEDGAAEKKVTIAEPPVSDVKEVPRDQGEQSEGSRPKRRTRAEIREATPEQQAALVAQQEKLLRKGESWYNAGASKRGKKRTSGGAAAAAADEDAPPAKRRKKADAREGSKSPVPPQELDVPLPALSVEPLEADAVDSFKFAAVADSAPMSQASLADVSDPADDDVPELPASPVRGRKRAREDDAAPAAKVVARGADAPQLPPVGGRAVALSPTVQEAAEAMSAMSDVAVPDADLRETVARLQRDVAAQSHALLRLQVQLAAVQGARASTSPEKTAGAPPGDSSRRVPAAVLEERNAVLKMPLDPAFDTRPFDARPWRSGFRE